MFTVYSNDILIYDDTSSSDSLKLVSPKLSLSQSSAGTFTATVPPGNAGYDHLDRLTSWIRIFKDTQSDPFWEGRIISEKTDFWNCKQITCEGILGVLNDTIQPPYHYQNQSARSFLEALLNIHNAKVENWKKIYVGTVNVSITSSHRYTNYETTMECVTEKLLKNEGGYLQIRYDNGRRYLDYLSTYGTENLQKIEFGKNLLDFTKTFNSEDYCTVLVPRGMQLGEGPYEALVPYLDVSSVNDGSIYVTLTNSDFDTPPDVLPVDEFGWIEAVHDWEDVSNATTLLNKAKQFLKDVQFDNMELNVSALDMRYAGAQYEEIKLNDSVRVVSNPHGLDRLFPVTKLDIPLDSPESTQFTLGTSVQVSLTHRDRNVQNNIKNEIAQLPTRQSLVNEAKAEAATLIESAIEGYVTIIHNEETGAEELVISTTQDYLDPNAKIWRWNANGLAYSPTGYNSGNYTVAITNDGRINASLISTGTLYADIIKAGILQDQHGGNTFYLNLTTGELRIGKVDLTFDQLHNLGGRNYCWAISTAIHEEATYQNCTCTYNQNDNGKYIVTSSGGSQFPQAMYPANVISVPSSLIGEKMTLHAKSITASGTNDPRVFIIFANSSGSQIGTAPYIAPGALSTTFTVPSGSVSIRPIIRVRQNGTNVSGESVTVYGLKLEKGEVETDWTPAPEDESSARAKAISNEESARLSGDNDTFNTLSSSFSSEISRLDGRIETQVARVDELSNGVTREIASAIQQTESNISLQFLERDQTIQSINSNLATFNFAADGLEIKSTKNSASGTAMKLESDRLVLKENGSERLWLDVNGANAQYFNATNAVRVNDFIWERYPNGFRLRK